ncbi:MAG: hypothetical protein EBR82_12025 [Caulobacteraceae bacterium]|nr:hypothetical protein [Caulobacteraceae bacterium]
MATLTSYITEVRRLLHDANADFWQDNELTDFINDGREKVARDTGCTRTLQVSSTPISPNNTAAIPWAAGLAVTAGQYVFSNIFTYQVTVSGTLGTTAPPYPAAGASTFPPSTSFTNGTATLLYYAPTEIIPFSCLPSGINTLDILNINLYWGNTRVPLRYLPWTGFNSQLRYWQNYVGRPICFSVFGQQQIYISPSPDQSYVIELDTVVLPAALSLATPTATDTIIDPYTTPVSFYAAYKAKYKEQSYGEAEIFKQEYMKHVQSVLSSVFTRRIPDVYGS